MKVILNKCKITDCSKDAKSSKGFCWTHDWRLRKYGSPVEPQTKKQKLFKEGKSYCPSCKQIKSIDSFNKDRRTVYGITAYCKDCIKRKNEKNTIRNTNNYLKYQYGLTLEEYNNLSQKQNNQCRICNKSEKENKKRLAVDHNHTTGEIRGLLCSSCNQGLGKFYDSVQLLNNAIKYLCQT